MKQRYTSMNTSINSKRLPRIYNLVSGRIEGKTVIDYGCGKFFDGYGLPENIKGFDPYNRPDNDVLNSVYDVALCSNVLNVIMEQEHRSTLLENLKRLAGTVYITVYEGDRSGKGKATKDDCYQLNRRACDYIPELVEVFGYGNVRWNRKGFFECRGEAKA